MGVSPACLSPPVPQPAGPILRAPSTIPEALGADARVAVDRIHALGPVAAAVGHAIIVVHLAELPAVAGETFAPGTQQSKAVLWARLASRGPPVFSVHPWS